MVISERAQAKEEVRREVREMRSELVSYLISPIRSPQPPSRSRDIINPAARNLLHELAAASAHAARPSTSYSFRLAVPVPGSGSGTTSLNNQGSQRASRGRRRITPGARSSLLHELAASPTRVAQLTTSYGFQPIVPLPESRSGATSLNNQSSQTSSTSNPSSSSGVPAGDVPASQPLLPSVIGCNPVTAVIPFPPSDRVREAAERSTASQRAGIRVRDTADRSTASQRADTSGSSSSTVSPAAVDSDPGIPAFQYNPEEIRYSELTLRQACSVMATYDMDRYFNRIVSILCRYSMRIYGLEPCDPRDLELAVFFFIERFFNIQPRIELCVRGISDSVNTNVTGVVLDRSTSIDNILENLRFLTRSRYRIERNTDTAWIIENLYD